MMVAPVRQRPISCRATSLEGDHDFDGTLLGLNGGMECGDGILEREAIGDDEVDRILTGGDDGDRGRVGVGIAEDAMDGELPLDDLQTCQYVTRSSAGRPTTAMGPTLAHESRSRLDDRAHPRGVEERIGTIATGALHDDGMQVLVADIHAKSAELPCHLEAEPGRYR